MTSSTIARIAGTASLALILSSGIALAQTYTTGTTGSTDTTGTGLTGTVTASPSTPATDATDTTSSSASGSPSAPNTGAGGDAAMNFALLGSSAAIAIAALQSGSDDLPLRLDIPSLHIDAAVQDVGVKPDGSMGTPNNFTDVAWYKYGTVPGEIGSAVIDGHVDNGLSLAGVFKHLNNIEVGDEVDVQTESGKTLRFTVAAIADYDYKSVPTNQLFNASDVPRLNLITCDGAWVKGEKTYDHRLVVYTTLTSIEG